MRSLRYSRRVNSPETLMGAVHVAPLSMNATPGCCDIHIRLARMWVALLRW